jgi:hypothetical protein
VPETGPLGTGLETPENPEAVSVLVHRRRTEPPRIIAGLSNVKAARAQAPRFLSWTVQSGKAVLGTHALVDDATTGPMAMADVDGDGLLDLRVGTRSLPRPFFCPVGSRVGVKRKP